MIVLYKRVIFKIKRIHIIVLELHAPTSSTQKLNTPHVQARLSLKHGNWSWSQLFYLFASTRFKLKTSGPNTMLLHAPTNSTQKLKMVGEREHFSSPIYVAIISHIMILAGNVT